MLQTVFHVKDYQCAVEYQQRGSPHLHCLFWLEGAPNILKILNEQNTDNSEQNLKELQKACDYYSGMISCVNPLIGETNRSKLESTNVNGVPIIHTTPTTPKTLGKLYTVDDHPCEKEMPEYKSYDEMVKDLTDCLVTFNRHTRCTRAYCKKKVRKNLFRCRFRFPLKHKEKSCIELIKNEDGKVIDLKFLPKVNDSWMNKHIPFETLTWRANTDATVCVSAIAIIQYICKYICKGEVKSD